MKVIIVGAGVTGLTLAYLLVKKGFDVTVLEKEMRVGGLAKSYHYNGWSIDIGPHRFHTDDSVVKEFILKIMEDRLIEIPRDSKVFFLDSHYEWPLCLRSVLRLPPSLIFRACVDLLNRPPIKDDSYESYVLNRYGKTLTNCFFKEFNYKFLKVDLKEMHRHWAETGINRATIEKNIRMSSLMDLLLEVLSPRHVDTRFLYPKHGPIDIFSERLKEMIEEGGGKVESGIHIKKALVENHKVKTFEGADGKTWESDYVFWTGVIHDLESLLGYEPSQLGYCSTVLCNLLVEGTSPVPSQWEYFGSSKIIFSRTSTNIYFNPCLAPEGYYGICAELVCYEEDFVWKKAETLLNSLIQNLIHTGVIHNFNSIVDVHFERVSNTYPIYRMDYLTQLEKYKTKIENIKNVLACGRIGGFWYNNMDHAIRSSIDIAQMVDSENFSEAGSLPIKGIYRGDF